MNKIWTSLFVLVLLTHARYTAAQDAPARLPTFQEIVNDKQYTERRVATHKDLRDIVIHYYETEPQLPKDQLLFVWKVMRITLELQQARIREVTLQIRENLKTGGEYLQFLQSKSRELQIEIEELQKKIDQMQNQRLFLNGPLS